MMKNLFDYATKELSQDAFLRWLFENYNCENGSVKNAFRKLFDSFTNDKFKCQEISELQTVAQWKNIDVSIWFKVNQKQYLIVIEDKMGSGIHDDQLKRYEEKIIEHNAFWKDEKNQKKYPDEKYNFTNKDEHVFKIFYKTNIVDGWEEQNTRNYKWKKYDIYAIYDIFSDIETDNEVLGYYIEHIKKIHSAAKREQPPSEWGLISWHSFFNDYKTIDCISEEQEINCYQKQYYYAKLFVKGHKNDLPCLEIRSRDFKHDKENGKWSITAKAVLYNLSNQADAELIKKWQSALTGHGFKLNNRKEVTTHKQIGSIKIKNIENNEKSLVAAFDSMSKLLSKIF